MLHILLVDDDELLRGALRLMLVNMGHHVTELSDGRETLRLCELEPPDLLVTDLIMPGVDGLETIAALRRAHPDVKIIAMSGGSRFNAHDFLRIAKMMGAHAILEKPFTSEAMATAIQVALAAPNHELK